MQRLTPPYAAIPVLPGEPAPQASFKHSSYNEPGVHCQRCQQSVVAAHDVKTLHERRPVVLGRLPFALVVGHGCMYVDERQPHASGLLHYTYAPVNVGRMAVTQVVREAPGYVRACVESLMAHPACRGGTSASRAVRGERACGGACNCRHYQPSRCRRKALPATVRPAPRTRRGAPWRLSAKECRRRDRSLRHS